MLLCYATRLRTTNNKSNPNKFSKSVKFVLFCFKNIYSKNQKYLFKTIQVIKENKRRKLAFKFDKKSKDESKIQNKLKV